MASIYDYETSDQTIVLRQQTRDTTMGAMQRFRKQTVMVLISEFTTGAVMIYVKLELIRSTTHSYRLRTASL